MTNLGKFDNLPTRSSKVVRKTAKILPASVDAMVAFELGVRAVAGLEPIIRELFSLIVAVSIVF